MLYEMLQMFHKETNGVYETLDTLQIHRNAPKTRATLGEIPHPPEPEIIPEIEYS